MSLNEKGEKLEKKKMIYAGKRGLSFIEHLTENAP